MEVFYKKDILKVSQNLQKNTRAGASFSIKLQVSGSNFIEKENPKQVFFCEFCEKNLRTFFFLQSTSRRLLLDVSVLIFFFFNFRFVLLLHSSVKFNVSVMLGCIVIKN